MSLIGYGHAMWFDITIFTISILILYWFAFMMFKYGWQKWWMDGWDNKFITLCIPLHFFNAFNKGIALIQTILG